MDKILHFDCSGNKTVLLVSRGNEILDFREEDTSGSHGNILPQLLQQIIGEKGFRWKDFCALSLMNGPGSYTGLRVASAFAKAVGFVHHLPLILHNALDYAYRSIGDRSAVYIKHARADEYFGLYPMENRFAIIPLENIMELDTIYEYNPENIHKTITPVFLDPSEWIKQTLVKYKQGEFADLENAEPFYLRDVYIKKR